MKKVKLSDLIVYYQGKLSQEDDFFETYFEETDLKLKLKKLELMYKLLGDIILPHDYFKVFLYTSRSTYDEKQYESMITDIYSIVKKYEDMPIFIIDELLSHYDEQYFKRFQVEKYFDSLVSKYGLTQETLKKCIEYIEDSKKKLKEFYEQESKKLILIKDEYPYEFISHLTRIIQSHYISFDEVMSVLPPDDFFEEEYHCPSEYWRKYRDYKFIFDLLEGKIKLEDCKDDDYIETYRTIDQTEKGIMETKKYTSFTKREYLEKIGKIEKVKKIGK